MDSKETRSRLLFIFILEGVMGPIRPGRSAMKLTQRKTTAVSSGNLNTKLENYDVFTIYIFFTLEGGV
jgi:hypothetical protein